MPILETYLRVLYRWYRSRDIPGLRTRTPFRRSSYNVPRTFRHLNTGPSSSLSAQLCDEQKEVLDGVGMGWNHNMNWASRASRGGNFHERPVQNEKICVRSLPDRLRVKETISWHLCRMTSLSVEISCSLTLLSSSDLSHLRSFSWHLFLLFFLASRSVDIWFFWHLLLMSALPHVFSFLGICFSWHLFCQLLCLTPLSARFVLQNSRFRSSAILKKTHSVRNFLKLEVAETKHWCDTYSKNCKHGSLLSKLRFYWLHSSIFGPFFDTDVEGTFVMTVDVWSWLATGTWCNFPSHDFHRHFPSAVRMRWTFDTHMADNTNLEFRAQAGQFFFRAFFAACQWEIMGNPKVHGPIFNPNHQRRKCQT